MPDGTCACFRCGKRWFTNDGGVDRVAGPHPDRNWRCAATWECEQRRAQRGIPSLQFAPPERAPDAHLDEEMEDRLSGGADHDAD